MSAADAPHATLLARFRAGLTWNVVGAVMNQGASFLASIAVARIVGRDAYGMFALVSSTVITAAGMAQLATGFTATKFVAEFRHAEPLRASRIAALCQWVAVITGILATLVITFGAQPLARLAFGEPALAPLLLYSSGYILFTVMTGVQQGALAGCEGFKALARINLAHGVLYFLLCVLAAKMFGVAGALVALSMSAAIRWMLLRGALRAVWRERLSIALKDAFSEKQALFGFAVPAALSGIVTMSALWLGNAILVNGERTLGEMALFGAALSLKTLILFVPRLVDNVGMTLLNSARGGGNRAAYRHTMRMNLLATGAVSGIMSVATVLLAPQLIGLFGSDFIEGANVLRVLAFAAFIQAIANTLYQGVQSEGRIWFSLLGVCIPRDGLLVVLAVVLVPQSGALGLAIAHAGSAVIGLLILLARAAGVVIAQRAGATGGPRV
jgi:O-antigen/teichoic acid export membrane protein